MDIYFLGTGSARPSKERDNTSLCLSNDGYYVLVDVSANPCRKLKQLNIDIKEVNAVVFTHLHIDHIYGLPSLLWGMWVEGRKKTLTLYCDARYKNKLNEWLHTIEVKEWNIQFLIQIETFNGNHTEVIIEIDDLAISCFPAIHSVPTIGLEIKYKNKVIVYSGDTEINPLIQSYSEIDLLIHEATTAKNTRKFHSSAREVIHKYDLSSIKAITLIHLTDDEPYEKEISKSPKNKIELADDMKVINI